MPSPRNIQIDEVILHRFDPKSKRPRLSDSPIPNTPKNSSTFGYFRKRIEAFSRDSAALPARFRNLSATTAVLCQGLLTGTTDLAAGSQQLASTLSGILRGNSSIALGDLAVCRYRATVNGIEGRYLAILKIDPTRGWRPVIRKDRAGRYLAFKTEPEVFTSLGYRLQKCALIRELDPRPADFDLVLLDRQARATAEPEVAHFFTEDFLEVEIVPVPHPIRPRKFRDEEGLIKLSVPADLYPSAVQVKKIEIPASDTPYYEVVIHTKTWAEV